MHEQVFSSVYPEMLHSMIRILGLTLAIFSGFARWSAAETIAPCRETLKSRRGLVDSLLKGYDRSIVPSDTAVKVLVEMTIQDITEVSEITSSFKVRRILSPHKIRLTTYTYVG